MMTMIRKRDREQTDLSSFSLDATDSSSDSSSGSSSSSGSGSGSGSGFTGNGNGSGSGNGRFPNASQKDEQEQRGLPFADNDGTDPAVPLESRIKRMRLTPAYEEFGGHSSSSGSNSSSSRSSISSLPGAAESSSAIHLLERLGVEGQKRNQQHSSPNSDMESMNNQHHQHRQNHDQIASSLFSLPEPPALSVDQQLSREHASHWMNLLLTDNHFRNSRLQAESSTRHPLAGINAEMMVLFERIITVIAIRLPDGNRLYRRFHAWEPIRHVAVALLQGTMHPLSSSESALTRPSSAVRSSATTWDHGSIDSNSRSTIGSVSHDHHQKTTFDMRGFQFFVQHEPGSSRVLSDWSMTLWEAALYPRALMAIRWPDV